MGWGAFNLRGCLIHCVVCLRFVVGNIQTQLLSPCCILQTHDKRQKIPCSIAMLPTSARDDAKRKEASLVMHAAPVAFSKAFVRNISHAASMGGDSAEARAFAKYEDKSI